MPVRHILTGLWQWIADLGIPLAILFVIALLVPRVGRFVQRWLDNRFEASDNPDESKVRMAVAGVSVYIGEMVAYFLLLIAFLQMIGFSLAGAAIPATVVSAAIGFGAQSIIADFLAGFFILSEKQFGVGDWVRFEGNGITVEGTVIQVTMRATRIRTLAQETVIVPNSTARVSINTSNYWSRAVVVIPVPLLGSDSPQEAIARSEAATRRALERPDVAPELLGELDVHPAVGVNPPATVGMPWTVDMRFMMQVTAGSQWLVERAIRTSILEEFWDEYGSAPTMTGELQDQVHTAPAPEHDTTAALRTAPRFDVPVDPAPTEAEAATTDATEIFEQQGRTAVPGTAETTALPGSPDRPETPSTPPPGYSDEEGKDPAIVDKDLQIDEPDAEDGTAARRRVEPTTRWQKVTTLNGRTRPSTTYLFAALFLLLILRGLTLSAGENGEGASGILAPPAPAPAPETTVEPEPTPSPETVPPTPTTPSPEITTTPETPQGTQTPQSPDDTQSPQETPTSPGTQPQQPQVPDQTTGPAPTTAPGPSPGTGGGGTTPQDGGPEAASTPATGVEQPLN